MTQLYEMPDTYKVGKTEGDGDRRRFYKDKQLALNYANDAAAHWADKVSHVLAQFEPNHGFVPILVTSTALPEAQAIGFEIMDVALLDVQKEKTPDNWAKKKKQAATKAPASGEGATPRVAGSRRPSRGKTLQAWVLFDSMPDATRKERIAAGVAKGLDKSTVSTQHSRWAKEQE